MPYLELWLCEEVVPKSSNKQLSDFSVEKSENTHCRKITSSRNSQREKEIPLKRENFSSFPHIFYW
jgi:hypothetical protein